MSIRDILVQVDERGTSAARCELAAVLARKWDAALTGVYLQTPYPSDVFAAERLAYLPRSAAEALKTQHDLTARHAVEAAEQTLRRAAESASASFAWRQIDGGGDSELIAAARRTDLVIFPPCAITSLGGRAVEAATLGLACGGPVLVAPEQGAWTEAPKRILVAWKNTREAARALHDAWPFLEAADEVTVVMVRPSGEEGAEDALAKHLARHGCQAQIIVERHEDLSAAGILRGHVEARRTDLVVMGLYGRPRVSEWVLGGVSREFLDAPPAPLLVSH
jgi:nucleotide-binding universal stress UspA family protein